jgi:hypothetical protein
VIRHLHHPVLNGVSQGGFDIDIVVAAISVVVVGTLQKPDHYIFIIIFTVYMKHIVIQKAAAAASYKSLGAVCKGEDIIQTLGGTSKLSVAAAAAGVVVVRNVRPTTGETTTTDEEKFSRCRVRAISCKMAAAKGTKIGKTMRRGSRSYQKEDQDEGSSSKCRGV